MSRYYNIPNKVNLPLVSPLADVEPGHMGKGKASILIEHEKKSVWPIRHRYPNISTSKENTPPRRMPVHPSKLHKPWQTVVKTTVTKPGRLRKPLRRDVVSSLYAV